MKDLNEKELALHCGNRIRLLRERLGMNQQEFGEFLDCSDESISKIERGMHMMKTWRMIRLCQTCDVSLDYLVRGIDAGDSGDVPSFVVEMYRDADSTELDILQDHMKNAQREITRKHALEKQCRSGQDET